MRLFIVTLLSLSGLMGGSAHAKEAMVAHGRLLTYEGHPVAGAEVVCYEQLLAHWEGQRGFAVLGRTQSDADGRFRLSIVVRNSRNVWAAAYKEGLALGWQHALRWINYPIGLADAHFQIRLGKPHIVGGQVVDEDGRPIPGSSLRICLRGNRLSTLEATTVDFCNPVEWFTTRTDAQGRFRFTNIPAGVTADFRAEAAGKAGRWTFYGTQREAGFGTAVGQTDALIMLRDEARIEGCVVDQKTGEPVSGVRLLARPDQNWADYWCADPVLSGPDGRFVLAGLPADDYTVQVIPSHERTIQWVGQSVKVTLQKSQVLNDINVLVGKGATLKILVSDISTDSPIKDATALITQKGTFERWGKFSDRRETDPHGFAYFRVPPGTYGIRAYAKNYEWFWDPEPVIAQESGSFNAEIQLNRYPCVRGLVTDSSGQPVPDVLVTSHRGSNSPSRTDTEGQYYVSWSHKYNDQIKFLLAQHEDRNLTRLKSITQKDHIVDLELEPALILEGTVTDPDGRGVPAVLVQLSGPGGFVGQARLTNSAGQYQIRAVPKPRDGLSYRLSVETPEFGPKTCRDIPIRQTSEETAITDPIVLRPANLFVSGVVVDLNGMPMAETMVFLTGKGQRRRKVVTNMSGQFIITGLCDGPVKLQAGNDPKKMGFLNAHSGDQDVKIVMGRQGIHERHLSLKGKSMPSLEELGFSALRENFEGRSILLCFFDMNQRPSRNAVIQLARQAAELKQKGVAVIAIQTSKVAEDKLNKWVKDQSISFPVGMVRSDEEEIRFTWGVKSLPWLILTDKQHIVRAEGFAVVELHEKLKANK